MSEKAPENEETAAGRLRKTYSFGQWGAIEVLEHSRYSQQQFSFRVGRLKTVAGDNVPWPPRHMPCLVMASSKSLCSFKSVSDAGEGVGV